MQSFSRSHFLSLITCDAAGTSPSVRSSSSWFKMTAYSSISFAPASTASRSRPYGAPVRGCLCMQLRCLCRPLAGQALPIMVRTHTALPAPRTTTTHGKRRPGERWRDEPTGQDWRRLPTRICARSGWAATRSRRRCHPAIRCGLWAAARPRTTTRGSSDQGGEARQTRFSPVRDPVLWSSGDSCRGHLLGTAW